MALSLYGAQESIPSLDTQVCAIDSLLSISGLLKRLQIWAQESVCVGVGKTVRGPGFTSICNYISMVLTIQARGGGCHDPYCDGSCKGHSIPPIWGFVMSNMSVLKIWNENLD